MKSDLFRSMPPMRHDRIWANSEVLAHIISVTGSDLPGAIKTFQYLRNRGHIVFTVRNRTWAGAEHVPNESDGQFRIRVSGEVSELRRIIKENLAKYRKLQASHDLLLENFNNLVSHINKNRG